MNAKPIRYENRSGMISIRNVGTWSKAVVRPHLDYGIISYDNQNNETFRNKIVSLRYNAALVNAGVIRGPSREKHYQELGLEYISDRRWCRKLCLFHKIINNQTSSYRKIFISSKRTSSYSLRISKIYSTSATRILLNV